MASLSGDAKCEALLDPFRSLLVLGVLVPQEG